MASLSQLKGLLRWARTSKSGDDSGELPVQQTEYLGKVGDAVAWFPYGFHAVAPPDELALLLSLQGNPEARVAISGSPTKRVRIASGEVVIYHPETGTKIHFKANGDIEVVAPNVKVTGKLQVTGDVTIVGAVTITGNVATTGTLTNNGVNVGSTHVHSGVQTGAGNTGPPQ